MLQQPATFDGAASQDRQTVIRSYDQSIFDTSSYLASKVYTEPISIPVTKPLTEDKLQALYSLR